jgi:hypothetical protein
MIPSTVSVISAATGNEVAKLAIDLSDGSQFSPKLPRLRRVSAMFEGVLIPPWRAGVCAAVHAAPFLALHRWRLARRALAGFGQAAGG